MPDETHLPSYDLADSVEHAMITRLANNWRSLASMKSAELNLDALYKPNFPDYSESKLPFHDVPVENLVTFTANDLGAWRRIVDLVSVTDSQRLIDDCQADLSRAQMLNDYSGLYWLCQRMDVADSVGLFLELVAISKADDAETESGDDT